MSDKKGADSGAPELAQEVLKAFGSSKEFVGNFKGYRIL